MEFQDNLSYLIDKKSMVSLYKQVEEIIKQLVYSPPYNNGEYLPGEHKLVSSLGVSRHTVRQALQNLISQGLLIRERGRGTRCTQIKDKIYTNISAWSSFTEEMMQQGYQSKLQFVQTGTKIPPNEVSILFNSDLELAYLIRQYGFSAISQTDIYFESYFNPALNLDKDVDFREKRFKKLYEFLKQKKDVLATSSKEKIEVILAKQQPYTFLEKFMGDIPIIKRTRIVYDQNGIIIEYNLGYYRSDVFVLQIESNEVNGI